MKNIFTNSILAFIFVLIYAFQLHAQTQNGIEFNISWNFDGNTSGVSTSEFFQVANAQVSPTLSTNGFETIEGPNQALITSGWGSDTTLGPFLEVQFTPTQYEFLFQGVNARLKRAGGGPSQIRVTYTLTKNKSTEDSININLTSINLTTEEYTDIFIRYETVINTFSTVKIRYYGLSAPGPNNTLNFDYIRAFGERWFGVLPVTLTYFRAQTIGNTIALSWETALERNSREFIIQRSSDLKEWGDIDSVPAAGESDGRRQYSYIDSNPMMGINYYRLRMVDRDDTYEHSQPKDAIYRPDQPQFIVSPNPVASNDAIRVRTWNIDTSTLRLTSLLGQSIPFRITKISSDSWEVRPGSPLASGFYFLTVDQPIEPLTVRIMVP